MRFASLTPVAILGALLLAASSAHAAPSKEDLKAVKAKHKEASRQFTLGENEAALALIEEGLAVIPNHLDLLLLRGHVLLKMRSFEEALTAYQTYLDAGAKGGNRREVLKIMKALKDVADTILIVNVTNGPAEIYLDSKKEGVFCVADPECKKGVLPGPHRLIIEREGYARISESFSVAAGKTHEVTRTLDELPSPLTITVEPPGAALTLDGEAIKAGKEIKLSPGEHTLTASLEGYGALEQKLFAREGKEISLSLVLVPLLQVEISPSSAEIFLDGAPVPLQDGKLSLPPSTGAPRSLTARAPGYHEASVPVPDPLTLGASVSLTLQPIGSMLSIEGVPPGATLSVDGEPKGTLPLQSPLEIPPGTHTIEITAEGFLPFSQSFTFSQNTPARIDVKMRREGKPKTWLSYSAAGGAAALGSVFGLLALSRERAFEERSQLPGVISAPGPDGNPVDEELQRLKTSGRSFSIIADVSFGAAILAASAGTYFFFKEGEGFSEGRISVLPALTPDGVALTLSGPLSPKAAK